MTSPSARAHRCERCDSAVPPFESVNLGSAGKSRFLCTRCYNADMEIGFHHPDFQPMSLAGADGAEHTFHFVTRLIGNGIIIEAMEIQGNESRGYQFAVLGEVEDDPLVLFADLLARVRREIGRTHLERRHGGLVINEGNAVRGRIEWDDETEGELPALVIDGQAISWEQLGRMLMTYEGWQFRLEIVDKTEEP